MPVSTILKFGSFAVIAVVVALLPRFMGEFRLSQFTFVALYFIALLGLNILTGYNGQISLGHGAFMGIGAYVSALLILGRPGLELYQLDPPELATARRRDEAGVHDPARRPRHGPRRHPVRDSRAPPGRGLARARHLRDGRSRCRRSPSASTRSRAAAAGSA